MRNIFHKNSSICPAGSRIMDENTRECFLKKVNIMYKRHTFLKVSTEVL